LVLLLNPEEEKLTIGGDIKELKVSQARILEQIFVSRCSEIKN